MEKKKVILISHGKLSEGMADSVEMIIGNAENLSYYGLQPGEMPDAIAEAIEKEINAEADIQFVILADLLGGSVSNAVSRLTVHENVVLINGMNMILVISILLHQGTMTQAELDTLIEESKCGITQTKLCLDACEDDII